MPTFPDDSLRPAMYFPLGRGRFAVTPGFFPISTDFGNPAQDGRLFQIDRDFARFRANTVAARAECFGKYVCFDPEFGRISSEVCERVLGRLLAEYPAYFVWEPGSDGAGILRCGLTDERLHFDRGIRLVGVTSGVSQAPAYENAFDALMSQVPEDMAVVALPEGEPDKNVALHVTAPSHWAPGEKIGRSFLQTHTPVPNFGRIAAASANLLENVRARPGAVVRFNWGIEFTDRLNLHTEPPPDVDAREWDRRRICPSDDIPFHLRIERQVMIGLKVARAVLFAIRIYVRPVTLLSPEEQTALLHTLLSMPEASRRYKGLAPETFAEVMDWLQITSERK